MEVYVCQLVPTLVSDELQAKINEFNDQLLKWGNTNSISIINCNLPYRLATGNIDDMCFVVNEEDSTCLLNRLGVIRLLDHISKQCIGLKLSDNWNKIKSNQFFEPKNSFEEKEKYIIEYEGLK